MPTGKFKTLDLFKIENNALCARVVISFIHSTFFPLKLKTIPRYLKFWTISTFFICSVKSASMFKFALRKYSNFCLVSVNS